MTDLNVHLLGTLELYLGREPLPLPSSSDARALLAYLLLYRQHPHPRSVLADLIAPDLSEARARRALTQALYHVRQTLPQGLIVIQADSLHIPPEAPIWVDVQAFQTLVEPHLRGTALTKTAATDLFQAVELYRGDLLEDIYDDWTLVERERLREQYLVVLERLIELEKRMGRFESALELALTLLEADPLREAIHREIMRLYYSLGRPEAALQQFETCAHVLKSELGLQPAPETVALVHEIRDRSGASPPAYLPEIPPVALLDSADPSDLPLIGRTQERAQLLAHLEGILSDGPHAGGLVLVEGEAGVGKTRLLQELARDATWRGTQVLWGECLEQRPTPAYQPLVQALSQGLSPLRVDQLTQLVPKIWLEVLRPLLPDLPDLPLVAALEPAQERRRLSDAFIALLSAWAQITPMLLILEDLHWADEDTLDLMARLIQRLSDRPILMIGSYRAQARARPDVWKELQTLDRLGLRQRLILDRLDSAATAELIRRHLGLTQTATLFETRLYQETAGNPLFVLETLRVLYEEGLLRQDQGGQWHTPFDETTVDYVEIPLPPGVERTIARRLARLPSNARRTLQTAAVLGDRFDFPLLKAVNDQQTADLLSTTRELVHRRLLAETPQGYRFNHNKVRKLAYQSIPSSERVRLHRRAAQALEASGSAQVETLAYHFGQGEMWSKAIQYNVQAGDRSGATYAVQAALDYYEQALRILDQQTPLEPDQAAETRFDVLVARQKLLWIKGDYAQQEADLTQLLRLAQELGDPVRQIQVLNRRADFLYDALDEIDQAQQLAQEALSLAQKHEQPRQAATALELIEGIHFTKGEDEQAAIAARQALDIRLKLGESGRVSSSYRRLFSIYQALGDKQRAADACQAALEHARKADDPLALAQAYLALSNQTYHSGDLRSAIQHIHASRERVQAIGFRHLEARLLSNLGLYHGELHDYGPAVEHYRQALKILRELEERMTTAIVLCNLGALYLTVGQHGQALKTLRAGLRLGQELNHTHIQYMAWKSLGRLHLDQGNLAQAENAYQQSGQLADQFQAPEIQANKHLGLGRLYQATGDPQQACQHFNRALEGFRATGVVAKRELARSHLAVCRQELGDLAEAAQLSSQIMADPKKRPRHEFTHVICFHHWRIMQAAGREADAREALTQAYQLVQSARASLPDPAWQQDLVDKVPINQAIVSAYEKLQATLQAGQFTVHLACVNAPTGRPLRPDEMIEVNWTLDLPEDQAVSGKVARRHHRLLRLLDEAQVASAAPTIDDLAQALQVSGSTIKRDLAALRRAGHTTPTRGSRVS